MLVPPNRENRLQRLPSARGWIWLGTTAMLFLSWGLLATFVFG